MSFRTSKFKIINTQFEDHTLFGKYNFKPVVCKNDEDLRYGNYKTIEEAEIACLGDDSCHMVMDKGCKVKGPFQLCRSTDVCESHIGSCVYHKIT